jgi:RNA polymerase sigma-70 factor (ECF subfamily)
MTQGSDIHGLVDHLFRHEAGRMVASLTRSLGPANLALAEEVVQEALLQALKRWPFGGVPEKPVAWLYRVAHNLALDRLRRGTNFSGKEAAIREALLVEHREDSPAAHLQGEITDDQLHLIFLCCHPDLSRDARVALTLKTVVGFSVPEIARAFLVQGATISQRLVRAQRRIRQRRLPFEVPPPKELPQRLEAVLEVIYLMFNEGYSASDGDTLIRTALCAEALRLVEHLAKTSTTTSPVVHALTSLLCFQASRLPARVDAEGDLLRLHEQNRALWDQVLLRRAFEHLGHSASGTSQSEYHLQAGIAAFHASAPSSSATDWEAILDLYSRLFALNPSPIVALNRAVAVAQVQGPAAGLEEITKIEAHPAVAGYYLLSATRGEFLAMVGDRVGAAEAYRRALECSCSGPERRFLLKKLETV